MQTPRLRLNAGERYLLDGEEYRVDERRGAKIVLKAAFGPDVRILDDDELMRLFVEGRMKPAVDGNERPSVHMAALPEEQVRVVERRLHYVRALMLAPRGSKSKKGLTRVIEAAAQQLGDPSPPACRTVQKWHQKFVAGGRRPEALAPAPTLRRRKRRFVPLVEQAIADVIDRGYLTLQQRTISSVYDDLVAELHRLRGEYPSLARWIKVPSLGAFYERIKELDPRLVMERRAGKGAADRHFRIKGLGPRYSRPLEMVLCDTWAGHILMTDELGNVLGRIYITVVLDAFSRMVVGFYAGPNPPSWATVMQALRNAMAPKTYVADLYPDIKSPWPACGRFEGLRVDPGSENHNLHMPAAAGHILFDVDFNPAGRPDWKGMVERFLRTMATALVHNLPGTTKSNPQALGELQPVIEASLTLEDLREALHRWIIDIYHNTPHSELGETPLQAWQRGVEKYGVLPPPSDEELAILLAKTAERKLQHYGIEFLNQIYRSSELSRLRAAPGEDNTVRFKYDPWDISRIWVIDEKNRQLIPALADDQEYTKGLSEFQHETARKAVLAKGAPVNGETLRIEKAALLARHAPAKRKGKKRRVDRAAARRVGDANPMPFGAQTARPGTDQADSSGDDLFAGLDAPPAVGPAPRGDRGRDSTGEITPGYSVHATDSAGKPSPGPTTDSPEASGPDLYDALERGQSLFDSDGIADAAD